MSKQWFVVYCKNREESRALQNLENQGVTSFFPKVFRAKLLKGKKTVVEEALFPSYLFVFADIEDLVFPRIRSTRGVNDFVRFGGQIAVVTDALIAQLKTVCHAVNKFEIDTQALLKKGDKIEVLSGAFKGAVAIFSSNDGLERSMLLLNILNQENKISFRNHDIKKLAS